jgi:hypothetical protein
VDELLQADKLANAIAGAVTALIIAGSLLKGWMKAGKEKGIGPNGGEVVELAGALIDGKDARALTHALDRNTAELKRCGDATEKSADRVEDATREIRRMTDEMIRGQH